MTPRNVPARELLTEREQEDLEAEASGWVPVDFDAVLSGIVDGTLPPMAPEVLAVQGAGCLLYVGRVNGIHGHSNAGKSWTALLACAQQLKAGQSTIYIDYEDTAQGVLERLVRTFRVRPKIIRERFIYISPTGRFAPDAVRRQVERLSPSLVVFDSTGESLAMDGFGPNNDEDVAAWFQQAPRFVAELGPAVLLLDHNPKFSEGDSLWPIGSQRKRSAITGAQYLQKVVTPFSKQQSGRSRIVCAKDRLGNYAEGETVAELKVDVRDERSRFTLEAPLPREVVAEQTYKARLVAICNVLAEADKPVSKSTLRKAVGGDTSEAGRAIDWLVDSGYIERLPGARGGQLHTLIRAYEPEPEASI
jgi:hypothetical protein